MSGPCRARLALSAAFSWFALGAPVAAQSAVDCGCIAMDRPPFNDSNFESPICNPANGHVYLRTTGIMGIAAARQLAALVEGYVVAINDPPEASWLLSTFGASERYWIGLSDEGDESFFAWDSGEAPGYSSWATSETAPNEPNDCYPVPPPQECLAEDYVITNWFPGTYGPGAWNDVPDGVGEHTYRAIIEVPISVLCLRVMPPGPSSLTGHSGVELIPGTGPHAGKSIGYGYYPIMHPLDVYVGHVDNETGADYYPVKRCFAITRSQFDAVYSAIQDAWISPPTYNLAFYNCTSWALDMARLAGIEIQNAKYASIVPAPCALYEALTSDGGSQCSGSSSPADGSTLGPESFDYAAYMHLAISAPASVATPLGQSVTEESLGLVTVALGESLDISIDAEAIATTGVMVQWGDGAEDIQQYAFSHIYSAAGDWPVALAIADAGNVHVVRFTASVGAGPTQAVALTAAPSTASRWTNGGFEEPAFPEMDYFVVMGAGSPGSGGIPTLAGSGIVQVGAPVALLTESAAAQTSATMIVGFDTLMQPLKGGVLVPLPALFMTGLTTDTQGSLRLQSAWPAGLPDGTALVLQTWINDPSAVGGWSSTNGLQVTQ